MPSAFDFIAREALSGQETARYRLFGLRINGGTPFLDMRPATEDNGDYHKASIRLDLARTRRLEAIRKGQRKTRLTDEEAIAESLTAYDDMRKRDIDLFADHVVTGWGIEYASPEDVEQSWPGYKKPRGLRRDEPVEGPMLDGACKPVELTPENARDFLKAVATRSANDWDLVRNFAKAAANFRATISTDEADDLGKNSPSGSSGN